MDMTVLKKLLATDLNNAQIAAMLGVSRERIRQIREKRELRDGVVTRGRPPGAQNKPRAEPPPLAHGMPVPEDVLAQLGKVPDRVIAEKVGRSVPWVVQLRKKKGIPSHRDGNKPAMLESLGLEPDANVAARFGVSEVTVTKLRQANKIPAFRPEK